MEKRRFITKILKTVECCGLKFRICDDGFFVDLRDGNTRKLINGRQAVILFSEEIGTLVMDKLFTLIKEFGYDKYTGERGDKP